MVSFRKITRVVLGHLFLFHSLCCMGQNVYNSGTIYYNMDTMRCVDKDIRFWDGDILKPYSGDKDSTSLYCVLREKIEVPIVIFNNDNINHLLDSCFFDTTMRVSLQYPDSSGYFIELYIFENQEDTSMLGLAIRPCSNYYMAELLSDFFRNDVYYEWYGYKAKELLGCFYWNNILCVISSQGWIDSKRVCCLFSHTKSTITLALFSPIVFRVSKYTPPTYYYYFHNCD